jgi:Trk K+ transport system NAD-binding subunit
MTIIGTVVIQGLAAAPLARRLGVTSMNVVIISADAIGRALARRLIDNGMSATMVDTDIIQVNLAREAGLNAHQGDGTDSDDLKRAGIERAKSFVAATSSDRTNLLACQIAMHRFGLEDLVARVNNPDQLETFKALGIRVVSPVVSTAVLLDSLVRQSSTLEMMYNQVPGQEVFEVTLNCKRLIEKPLREWDLQGDVLVALVRRNGSLFVPHGNTVMKRGDILTLMGVIKDVERARQMCEDE